MSVWLRLSHSLATWTVISVKDVVVNLMYTHWAHLSRINVFEDSQEKVKERVKTNCVIITLHVSFSSLLKLCGNCGGVVSLRFTVNWRGRKRLKSFDGLIYFTDSTCKKSVLLMKNNIQNHFVMKNNIFTIPINWFINLTFAFAAYYQSQICNGNWFYRGRQNCNITTYCNVIF